MRKASSNDLPHSRSYLPDDEVVKTNFDREGYAPEGCSLSPSHPSDGESSTDPELRMNQPRYCLRGMDNVAVPGRDGPCVIRGAG